MSANFLSQATNLLTPLGFYYVKGPESRFEKELHGVTIRISVVMKSGGRRVEVSPVLLTFDAVEEIIMDVRTPTNEFEAQRAGKSYLTTIGDYSLDSYSRMPKLRMSLKTEEEASAAAGALLKYVEGEGNDFFQKFSTLSNVLVEIERIDQLDRTGYLPFLSGGLDHLFRALIISKLCDDPCFEDKVDQWRPLFEDPSRLAWKPFFKKLLTKLEPIV